MISLNKANNVNQMSLYVSKEGSRFTHYDFVITELAKDTRFYVYNSIETRLTNQLCLDNTYLFRIRGRDDRK